MKEVKNYIKKSIEDEIDYSLLFEKDIRNGTNSKIIWDYNLFDKILNSVKELDKDKNWSDLDWIMCQNIEFLKFIEDKYQLNFKELYIEFNLKRGYHLVNNENDN
jgi:hypothetical protein